MSQGKWDYLLSPAKLSRRPRRVELQQLKKAADQVERATKIFAITATPSHLVRLLDEVYPFGEKEVSEPNVWLSFQKVKLTTWAETVGLRAAIGLDFARLLWESEHGA
jgi:hypothetical protein